MQGNRVNFLIALCCCLVTELSAGAWSQSTQAEFEGNTLANIDASTAPGDASISGEYFPDSNTVLLFHMNESAWNGATNDVSI